MKKFTFLAACFFTVVAASAQHDSTSPVVKLKKINVSVHTLDDKIVHGRLLAVNDSQLVLIRTSGQYPINAGNIQSFTFKRNNSALKGALIGFGVGVLTGVVAGLASGDDPLMEPSANDFGISAAINNAFAMTAGEKAVWTGAGLGVTGAIMGTIIGAVARKKFIIGAKKGKFRDLQAELMTKLVKK